MIKRFLRKLFTFFDSCKNVAVVPTIFLVHPVYRGIRAKFLAGGDPVASLGAPEEKVVRVGNGCVSGVVQSSGRSFTGRAYRQFVNGGGQTVSSGV